MNEEDNMIERSRTNALDFARDRGDVSGIDVLGYGEEIKKAKELASLKVTLDIIKMVGLEVLSLEARRGMAEKIEEMVGIGLENAVMGTSDFFEENPHAEREEVEKNLRELVRLWGGQK
jgi:hypothetical protein